MKMFFSERYFLFVFCEVNSKTNEVVLLSIAHGKGTVVYVWYVVDASTKKKQAKFCLSPARVDSLIRLGRNVEMLDLFLWCPLTECTIGHRHSLWL